MTMSDRSDVATVQLKIRMRESVRASLEQAAKLNEWPLNREIASRLDESLREESRLGGPLNANIFYAMASAIGAVERQTGEDWSHDYATWRTAKALLIGLIDDIRPMPPGAAAISKAVAGLRAAEAVETAAVEKALAAAAAYTDHQPTLDELKTTGDALEATTEARRKVADAKSALEAAFLEMDAANDEALALAKSMTEAVQDRAS
jgi:hypothetical protein